MKVMADEIMIINNINSINTYNRHHIINNNNDANSVTSDDTASVASDDDDDNPQTFDLIIASYESIMKTYFNYYLTNQIKVESDLRYWHKKNVELSLRQYGQWFDNKRPGYKLELQQRLNREFEQFIEYSIHYKKCLMSFVTSFIHYLQRDRDWADQDAFRAKCAQLIPDIFHEFDSPGGQYHIPGFDRNCRIFEYDFRQILIQHIEQHMRVFERNLGYLRQALTLYELSLDLEYRTCSGTGSLRSIVDTFNTSNRLIMADNHVYEHMYAELRDRCSATPHKFKDSFEVKLNAETIRMFGARYARVRRRESVIAGLTVASGAAIGALVASNGSVGKFAVFGSGVVTLTALGYFVLRNMFRPRSVRASLHGIQVPQPDRVDPDSLKFLHNF